MHVAISMRGLASTSKACSHVYYIVIVIYIHMYMQPNSQLTPVPG